MIDAYKISYLLFDTSNPKRHRLKASKILVESRNWVRVEPHISNSNDQLEITNVQLNMKHIQNVSLMTKHLSPWKQKPTIISSIRFTILKICTIPMEQVDQEM
jgi:hypothetical protein